MAIVLSEVVSHVARSIENFSTALKLALEVDFCRKLGMIDNHELAIPIVWYVINVLSFLSLTLYLISTRHLLRNILILHGNIL